MNGDCVSPACFLLGAAQATSLSNEIAGTAVNPAVNVLSQSISNPPTQAQVQAIQNKINELINAITRPAA